MGENGQSLVKRQRKGVNDFYALFRWIALLQLALPHYASRMNPGLGRRVVGFLTIVSVIVPILIGSAETASAATNCRKVMRDLQVQILNVRSNVNAALTPEESTKLQNIIESKIVAYPECKTEFGIWYQWNKEQNPLTPFPFGEAGDPRVYPLGPISWWWDKIYIDLFGRSIILMFLFGWEIFLGGLWAVIAIPIAVLSAIIPSLGKLVSAPFRWIRRRSKKNSKDRPPEELGLEEG